jgi:hypothetical protein
MQNSNPMKNAIPTLRSRASKQESMSTFAIRTKAWLIGSLILALSAIVGLPTQAATILCVLRDRDSDPSNGINMNPSDDPPYTNRLGSVLGHTLILLGNSPSQVATPDDWKTNGPIDMVFISGSVRVGDVAAAYRDCNVPVVYSEAGITAPQGMADDTSNQAGALGNQTNVLIVNPSHPLAAGFSGVVNVYLNPTPNGRLNYITTNAHLINVATVANNQALSVISGYEKGAIMFDSFVAPARRLNLFLPETDTTNATANGWALFDAGIAWALATPPLPTVTFINPTNGATFVAATNVLSFQATSTVAIATSGIKLVLNGFDETSNLAVSGSPTVRQVSFSGLLSNHFYTAEVTVSNALGTQVARMRFDTFSGADAKMIEAEDFNFTSNSIAGQFQNDPGPSGFDTNGARLPDPSTGYAALTGTPDIDYVDVSPDTLNVANNAYRNSDNVGTRITTDALRTKYITAAIPDYHVRHFIGTEWMNYTRIFANNSYNAYLRSFSIGASQVNMDSVTNDTTQTGQNTQPMGTFLIPDSTIAGFCYVPLTDGSANLAPINLSGTQTLRLTGVITNLSLDVNYILILPTSVQPPIAQPNIVNTHSEGNNIVFSFATSSNRRYSVQYKDDIAQATWSTLSTFNGNGALNSVTNSGANMRFFRVGVY